MIYKGARAVIQGGAQLGTSQKYADASARKAQGVRQSRESAATAKERVGAVEQTIESSGLRGDDGIPPGYPTVTAEAFFHQVDLYWPEPPASDEVVGSLVRIRPEGESSRIVRRPRHSATIKNLPHKPHTFEVLLFDKWGRESLWSDPVTATPLLTAAEEINLSEIAMLGRLRGLLPNTNLATITDATKLADELVSSGKIAPGAVTGPKLPDGVVSGPKIEAGAVSAPKLSANSVEAEKIAAGAITTPKMAAGSIVADTIAANAVTAPKILSDAIQTRHITAGAVTASVMAAQDAAAFNLWAQNAMIRSAAIQSITADKIAAGTMTAGQIALAGGGSLKAGGVTLDSGGITMAGHGYIGDTGSVPGDLSIHPPADYAKMWFWYSPEFSGVSVRAEPIDSTVRAAAYIGAFPNKTANTNSPNTGCIEFYSGDSNNPGQVEINGRTEVYGDMYVDGAFSPTTRTAITTIGANGDRKGFTHYQNTTMLQAHFQARVGTGQWRDISFLPELYIQYIDNEMIVVENNRGQAYDIRGWSWRVKF